MSTCTTSLPIVSALPNVHSTTMTLPHSPPPPSRAADWNPTASVTPPPLGPVIPKPRGRLSAPHALHFEIPQLPTPIPPSLLHRQSRSAPSLGALLPPVTLPAASAVPLKPSIPSPSEAALITGIGTVRPSAHRLRHSLTPKSSRTMSSGALPSPPINGAHTAAHGPGPHPTSKPALSTKRRRDSFPPSQRNGDSHPPRLQDPITQTERRPNGCNDADRADPDSDSDPHPSPDIDMEVTDSTTTSDSDTPRPTSHSSPSPP